MIAALGYDLDSFSFRQVLPVGALVVLLGLAIVIPAVLYFRERNLSLGKRVMLGAFRAVLLLLLLLLLFEPVAAETRQVTVPSEVLVLLDVSESMGLADDRKKSADLEEAALALNRIRFSDREVPDRLRSQVKAVPRLELARGILAHPDHGLFALNEKYLKEKETRYRMQFFTFGDRLEQTSNEPEELRKWLGNRKADSPTTRLGDALQQAVDRYSGQSIAAVVVLTDGASNEGMDPLEVARSLNVPILPIGIGLTRPEDVRLVGVTMPETVFPKDRVPVKVQLSSTAAFVGKEVEVTIKAGEKELDRKTVALAGAMQFVELGFVPEQSGGNLKLDIGITPLPEEATAENNKVLRTVKIIDEKIKVLFVEGRPRWEFRYLRAVLERDHRMTVKFLLTEGDRDLAQASDRYIARFPEDEKSAFEYDLVILGDVPAEFFTQAQLGWLDRLVREKGGSFLMLAGQRHAPMNYVNTPVAQLLPVKLVAAGRELVSPEAFPVPTPIGSQSPIMTLEANPEENRLAWSLVRPLYDVPRLDGAKQGATVLATLSDRAEKSEPYPLVAWQRYGSGKSMFVATDKLWRLRFKRGDEYHAHFWSQSIQFLTLSRLLGENKRVRLEAERKTYRSGEKVLVQATVLDGDYKPIKGDSYPVLIEQVPPRGEPRAMTLKSVLGQEGLFQGTLLADQPGDFLIRPLPQDEGSASRAEYQVEGLSREKLEPDMQKEPLEKIAELSRGKYLSVRDLPGIEQLFPDRSRTVTLPPRERELWNTWLVFFVILGLAGTEWFLRRRNDIA